MTREKILEEWDLERIMFLTRKIGFDQFLTRKWGRIAYKYGEVRRIAVNRCEWIRTETRESIEGSIQVPTLKSIEK